jgi:hypothetical protein
MNPKTSACPGAASGFFTQKQMLAGKIGCIGILGAVLFLFCASPTNNDKKNIGTASMVKIGGTFQKNLAKRSAMNEADSICAVKLENGEFTGGWEKLPGAIINPDGTFKLEIQKSSIDSAGVETPNDWMLLMLNSKAATRYDQVVGFIALKELDESMIKFPMARLKKDSLNMGKLTQKGNEAVADTNVNYDTTTFSLTLTQLREMAKTGRTLKMIKNSYGNYNSDKSKSIDIRPTYTLGVLHLEDALNKEVGPETYFDTAKFTLGLQLFSQDVQTFNYDQLINRTSTIDLYPPGQAYLQNFIAGKSYVAPINQCYSTDSSINPMIVVDTLGHTARTMPYFRAPSAGDDHFSIMFVSLKGVSPSGTWVLKKDKTTILSQFDLGLGCPVDTTTGKPIIYVPSVNVTVNADTTIQQIQVKWYYWDNTVKQYVQATDQSLIKNNISYLALQIHEEFSAPYSGTEGYDCGKNAYFGSGGVQNIPVVLNFVPAKKWLYKEPTSTDGKFVITINWCAANQTFQIQFVGRNTIG